MNLLVAVRRRRRPLPRITEHRIILILPHHSLRTHSLTLACLLACIAFNKRTNKKIKLIESTHSERERERERRAQETKRNETKTRYVAMPLWPCCTLCVFERMCTSGRRTGGAAAAQTVCVILTVEHANDLRQYLCVCVCFVTICTLYSV